MIQKKRYRADANKDKLVSIEDAIFALQINAGAIDNSKLIKHGIVKDFEYLNVLEKES